MSEERAILLRTLPGQKKRVDKSRKYLALIVVGVLTGGYSIYEIVISRVLDSVSLLSDGVHNLSDVISLLIAFVALMKSTSTKKDEYTYGWKRTEILGAVMNGAFLLSLALYILIEAVPKFFYQSENGDEIQRLNQGYIYIITAAAGLGINTLGTILFCLLSGGHGHVHAGGGDHGHAHGNSKKKDHKDGHDHHHDGEKKHKDGHEHHHSHGEKKHKEEHNHHDEDHHEHNHEGHEHHHSHGEKKHKEGHEHHHDGEKKHKEGHEHHHDGEKKHKEGHEHHHHDGEKKHKEGHEHHHDGEKKHKEEHEHHHHDGEKKHKEGHEHHHHDGEKKHKEGHDHHHDGEKKHKKEHDHHHDEEKNKEDKGLLIETKKEDDDHLTAQSFQGRRHYEPEEKRGLAHSFSENRYRASLTQSREKKAIPMTAPLLEVDFSDDSVALQKTPSKRTNLLDVRVDSDSDSHGDHDDHDHDDHHEEEPAKDMNIHAVFLHYLGDALSSIILVVTGVLVKFYPDTVWVRYLDPVASILIVILILYTTIPLLRTCSKILLQQTPTSLKLPALKEKLKKIVGVQGIHDLHVWQLVNNLTIATLHVKILKSDIPSLEIIGAKVKKVFHKFGIHSITLQPEFVPEGKMLVSCEHYCVKDCEEEWCCKSDNDSDSLSHMEYKSIQ